MKNNNLNVSIIFPGPFHFRYLFPINRDLAEHNSADKEVDGTADGDEETDDGCVQDRCYAFMKRRGVCDERPQSRAGKHANSKRLLWMAKV